MPGTDRSNIPVELQYLLTNWKQKYPEKHFPNFCPQSDRLPHTLIVLETPGPQIECVSMHNLDPTASELLRLVRLGFDENELPGVLVWNAIPWRLYGHKPTRKMVTEAKPLHDHLLQQISRDLKHVVLMGALARNLLVYFSTRVGTARIYGGHHTGQQAQNQPGTVTDNSALFEFLRLNKSSFGLSKL